MTAQGSITPLMENTYDIITDVVSFNHAKSKGVITQQIDLPYYDIITNFGNNPVPGTEPTMHWTA